MALQERIFGLETEYAINFYPAATAGRQPDKPTIVEVLYNALVQHYGVSGCAFLVTGAKFHHDVGHAEWAHPECRSAREAVCYDKAADHVLAQMLPRAQHELQDRGFEGQILVAKNNADFDGNTYGCHENYLMLKDNELLAGEHFLRYLARCLIPFLVTRQLFTGSGRLIFHAQRLHYDISQRAAFIDTIISKETTKERPIINLGREDEPLAEGNYRRLHLILGDANLSGWATWMKLGITGIILRMIEDMFLIDIPLLRDPLAALRMIARDTTCRRTLPMRDGTFISALDMQSLYYERADAYLAEFGCSAEEDALMDEWEKVLNDLAQDPMRLRDRVDWVIKKRFLDTYLGRSGGSWESVLYDQAAIKNLQAYDLRYHDIGSAGLFNQVFTPDTLVSPAEIQCAQQQPPSYTRARIRGEAIMAARRYSLPITVERWMELSFNGRTIPLSDPLEFDHSQLPVHPLTLLGQLEKACKEHPQDAEKYDQLARFYNQQELYHKARDAYQQAWKLQPQQASYVQNLALASRNCGEYQEAVDLYRLANQLVEEKMSISLNNMGEAYRYLGRYDEAIKVYQQEMKFAADVSARENLGQVALRLGHIDTAEEHFRRAMDNRNDRLLLISPIVLGVLQLWRGHRAEAHTLLRSALALPAVATIGITPASQRYFRAVAHIALGSEQGPSLLKEALERRGPAAAEGLFLLTPLIRLISQAPQPPENMQHILDLIQQAEETASLESQPGRSLESQISQQDLIWLRSIATHRDEQIRKRAARYLGWRKDDEALALLQEMVFHDESVLVRLAGVQTLGDIENPGATKMLLTCLEDAHPLVRWTAQETLEEKNQDIPPPPVSPQPSGSDDSEQLIQLM